MALFSEMTDEAEELRSEIARLRAALATAMTWALGEGPKDMRERSARQEMISNILLNQQSMNKEG